AGEEQRQRREQEQREVGGEPEVEAQRESAEVGDGRDRQVDAEGEGGAVADGGASHPVAPAATGAAALAGGTAPRRADGERQTRRLSSRAPHTVATCSSRMVPKKGRARHAAPAASA